MPLSTHTPVLVPSNGGKEVTLLSVTGSVEGLYRRQDDGSVAAGTGAGHVLCESSSSGDTHSRYTDAESEVVTSLKCPFLEKIADLKRANSQGLDSHLCQTKTQGLSSPARNIHRDVPNTSEGYICCAADLRLFEGTCAALLSPLLSEGNTVELCESLQNDFLQDLHPALLLSRCWRQNVWRQQQNGSHNTTAEVQALKKNPGNDVDMPCEAAAPPTCLLSALTVTLERHVNPGGNVSTAVALAVLQAQIVLLGRLREAMLTRMCDSDVGVTSDLFSPVRVAKALLEIRKLWCVGSFGSALVVDSRSGVPIPLGFQGRLCSCLTSTNVESFLKPVFITVLRRSVLLLEAQTMQLAATVIMLALDVATLLRLSSYHSVKGNAKLEPILGILSAEELVHAGQELRVTASEVFPCHAFRSPYQLSLRSDENGCTPYFDMVLDPLQDVAQLVPPEAQQQWIAVCDLQNLVLFLLRRTSVPLCRPQVLPSLLQFCGCSHQRQFQGASCFEGSVALEELFKIFRQQPLLGLASAESAATEAVAAACTVERGLWMADVALQLVAIMAKKNERKQKNQMSLASPLSEKSRSEERTCYFSSLSSTLWPDKVKCGTFSGGTISPRSIVGVLNVVDFLVIDHGDKPPSNGGQVGGDAVVRHIIRDLVDAAVDGIRVAGCSAGRHMSSSAQSEPPRFACCSPNDHMGAAVALVQCAKKVIRRCFAEALCSINDREVCDLLCCPDFLYECCLYGGETFEPVMRRATRQLHHRLHMHSSLDNGASRQIEKLLEFLTLWDDSFFNAEDWDTGQAEAQLIGRLKRKRLLRNLFSALAPVRQSAASELRLLSGASPLGEARMPLAADPVGFFILQKVEGDPNEELQPPNGECLWCPSDVEVLCSAAVNPRLDTSTRIQSLKTLRTIVLSKSSESTAFVRKLVVYLLREAGSESCWRQSTSDKAKRYGPNPSSCDSETFVKGLSLESSPSQQMTRSSSLLAFLVEMTVETCSAEDFILARSATAPSTGIMQETLLLATAVQFLSVPLQVLPLDDPLVFALLDLYDLRLLDWLPLLIFFSPSMLANSSLQLLARIVFHPAETCLLRYRVFPANGQLEELFRQHSQAHFREFSLLMPPWLASRVCLPLPVREVKQDSLSPQQCGSDQVPLQFDARSDQVALHVFHLAKASGALKCDVISESSVASPFFARSLWQFGSRVPGVSELHTAANKDLCVTSSGGDSQLQNCNICTICPVFSLTQQWSWCASYPVLPRIQLDSVSDKAAGAFISDVANGNIVVTPRVAQQLLMPSSAYLNILLRTLRALPDVLPHVSARGRVTGLPYGLCKPEQSGTARDGMFVDAVRCTLRILSAFGFPEDFLFYSVEHRTDGRGICNTSGGHERLLAHPCAQGIHALRCVLLNSVFPFIERMAEQLAELTVDAQDGISGALLDSQGMDVVHRSGISAYVRELDMLTLCLKVLVQVLVVSKHLTPLSNDNHNDRDVEAYKCTYCYCCSSVQQCGQLPDVPQILGNLIGISTDLPLLRRVVLKLGINLLPSALGPLGNCGMPEDGIEDVIGECAAGAYRGLKEGRTSSSMVLLQLQIQQLVADAALSSNADETLSSFQEQQSLADTLSCLNLCIRNNDFTDVAAAAANANAAARNEIFDSHSRRASPTATRQSHLLEDQLMDTHIPDTKSHRRIQHGRLLLLHQLETLFPLLHAAHPGVRVRAWECIEGCFYAAKGALKATDSGLNSTSDCNALSEESKHLISKVRQDVLGVFYSKICPIAVSTLQRLCGRSHEVSSSICGEAPPFCGWFCLLSPESLAEICVAASCIAAVRTISGSSAAPGQGDDVATAAGALDEWVASEDFIYKILRTLLSSTAGEPRNLPEFDRCGGNQWVSNRFKVPHSRCVVKARLAALKLVCLSAETRAGSVLNLLCFERTNPAEDAWKLPVDGTADDHSVVAMLVQAVNPSSRSPMSLLYSEQADSILSAAVAAAGTTEAEAASRAAVGVLGSALPNDELYAASWALKFLLSVIEASTPLREQDQVADGNLRKQQKSISIFVENVMVALVPQVRPLLCASLKALYSSYAKEVLRDMWPLCCCDTDGSTLQAAPVNKHDRTRARDRLCRWRKAAWNNSAALVYHILLQLLRIFATTAPDTCARVSRRLGIHASVLTQLEQNRIFLKRNQIWTELSTGIPDTCGRDTLLQEDNSFDHPLELTVSELWAQPSTWLLLSFCVRALALRRATNTISVALAREACTLTCCILLLSYERAVSILTGDKCAYLDIQSTKFHDVFRLPCLLPALPSHSLTLYPAWAQSRTSLRERSPPIMLPSDPKQAQGLFRDVAAALLNQLLLCDRNSVREGRVQGSKITSTKRRNSATSPKPSTRWTTVSVGSHGLAQVSSVQNNTSPHMHLATLKERFILHCNAGESKPSQAFSRHAVIDGGMLRRRSGSHLVIPTAEMGGNLDDRERSGDVQACHAFDGRTSLVHVLGESLLLLFAGHPTATTAAAWTQPLLEGPAETGYCREPASSALFATHLVKILESTMKGASASSILNFAASIRGQHQIRFPPLGGSGVDAVAKGQDPWNENQKFSSSSSHGDRSAGSVLMHRVVLILQLISAGATCTEDALAAAAAADRDTPFGTIVSVVRSLWRASSLQQTILSLVLHFMQRCVSPAFPKWHYMLASKKSADSESEQLSHIAEQLHAMRLYESGILDGLIDAVVYTLSSCGASLHKGNETSSDRSDGCSSTRQQKLPPRVLCSVLTLLQKTVKTVQDRSRLLQLAEGISSFVRLQLQQLLQRSSKSERCPRLGSSSPSACELRGMLGPWQAQKLHASLCCLTSIAAVTMMDRRTLATVLAADANGQRRTVRSAAGVSAEKTKEAFEDFTAPLLLETVPIGLVCALLEFFCSTAGVRTLAGMPLRWPRPAVTISATQENSYMQRDVTLSPRNLDKGSCDPRTPYHVDEHSPTASSMRLLLQQSRTFAAAVSYLLAVRLHPERCLTSGNIDQQYECASALYYILLLLNTTFLKEVRTACRLKQQLQTILNSLRDWEIELKTHLLEGRVVRDTSSRAGNFDWSRCDSEQQHVWSEILGAVTHTLSML